ncbi:hypothetical protein NEAUS04_1770 [Nematocida ausubeli]|nr:hypothetical protein NEAUS07_0575 [Nematocida ausubeli]KAI5134242.1 hypothetical protein NEAUS07_0774 [Nematocida ausubeli]KAI5163701.1 hypothetical protein NEAUS04_1770 [Nematocida ausubeli]
MSRAKPLSMEEKTKRVLSLLQEKDDVFNMKDLEKICQKEKGVVPQSMKEVLDILISERKAKEKKVGATKYYWSFRSDLKLHKEAEIRKITDENASLSKNKEILADELSTLKENRSSPEREEMIKQLEEKKKELESVNQKVAVMSENDPAKIDSLKEELSNVQKDLDEWAEAFNALQHHIRQSFNLSHSMFTEAFGISQADMDKIDEL